MADIRLERKSGAKAWLWIVLALIIVALVLFLLYQGGYIGGFAAGAESPSQPSLARLAATAASFPQEV